ncbi:hypothetical protein KL905_005150 [Ogataea polymorpha]|uniref:Uncharacterized protein n=1 Tax=Ogataea polymorpha TaxID=460523 RepID=A0A1B7SBD3_9ASCO|nr:uncharacterized protein OGAPODRAFT_10456 [Ogataea polymorpha]KAG7876861.1 hypothetical protein KL937_005160 [Ogataea polymorpha]KAG7885482.1 hypothetical protein KL936_005288 [Ogataea polymorpha]KAG7888626.1 hypothetical protein KL908_005173 [Ogataea polymorpha]KAG7897434.1 hypothetical protein KL935_005243 [Ogataea polymorpha]KAG7898440.1 hypothetical protein KL907_005200 [Ogataea polymorpha]
MSGRKIFQSLVNELQTAVQKAFEKHSKDMLKKQDALIQYKRLQYVRSGKVLSPEEDAVLVDEVKKSTQVTMPEVDVGMVKEMDSDSLTPKQLEHLKNMASFVRSQREYVELLERYNPGISMKQTDKVRKTARRVGLEVPE